MALKAQVESLEGVDEQYHDLYSETEDGFRLEVEGVEFPDEVKGLKSALDKEREARKRLEGQLGEIPDDWQDRLSEWEKLKEAERERERRKAEERGEFDKLRQQVQEQHEQARQEWQDQLQKVESQLVEKIRDEAIASAGSEHDAHVHLLVTHARDFVRIEDKNGGRVPVVVDEDGTRRINNEGEDMTIPELVAWMKEQKFYQPLFKASGATGGGAAGGDGAGSPGTRKKLNEMTDREKRDFIEEHGFDAYREKIQEAFAGSR